MYYKVIQKRHKTCNTEKLVVSKKSFCNTTKTPNIGKVSVLQCNTLFLCSLLEQLAGSQLKKYKTKEYEKRQSF